MDRLKSPSLLEANLIYLFLGMLLLSAGYLVQAREIYSGLLITEFIIILLPNLAYLKFRGYSLKKVLRLNRISLEQAIYSVFIMIFAYPVVVFINVIMISILSKFSTEIPAGVPLASNLKEFGIGLFVMAIAPGICEEVMFRGTMLDSYEKLGYKKSILITGVLFGIFHFNIYNFVGPAFLGIILGVLVYKTNSIFTSIIGHTINNGIALTIGYLITKYSSEIDQMANQPIPIEANAQILGSVIMLLILGAGSLFMLIFLLKKIPHHKSFIDSNHVEEVYTENRSKGFLDFVPVIIVLIVFINYNLKFLLN